MGQQQKEQSEFVIITKAKDLVKHTFLVTDGKGFPKKYRFTLVNRLQDRTVEIFECIAEANELDLTNPQEFRERQDKQKRALTLCKTVLFLIELCYERGCIDIGGCEFWSRRVLDVKFMTAKWKKQDRERAGANGAGQSPRTR